MTTASKATMDVVSDWRADPRLIAVQQRLRELAAEHVMATESARRVSARLREVDAAIQALEVRVLLKDAKESDVRRLQGDRERYQDELVEAQSDAEEIGARIRPLREAASHLEASLRMAAQRNAVTRYRRLVERMRPIITGLAAINQEILAAYPDVVNAAGIPGPLLNFRISNGSGELWHWLQAADSFNWSAYDASA